MGAGEPPVPIGIGCSAIKPVERHGWEAVSWFLYDKNTGAILGRTPMSWALIIAFYIVYYGFLAGFWTLMLFAFFQSLPESDKEPRWQTTKGLIGESPALGIRPNQEWAMIDSSMIIYRIDQEAKADKEKVVPGYKQWVTRTQAFLDHYNKEYLAKNEFAKDCSGAHKPNGSYPVDEKGFALDWEKYFCQFDLNILEECKGGDNLGYKEGEPCVILKLNRIYGLDPDYYHNISFIKPETLKKMPTSLVNHLNNSKVEHKDKYKVWVECHGENPADEELLHLNESPDKPNIQYFPKDAGFSADHFPYYNQFNYTSPLVAVKFRNLKRGVLHHIECRAWAGNIGYHKRDRIGRVHFEIMIHDECTAEQMELEAAGKPGDAEKCKNKKEFRAGNPTTPKAD